MLFSSLLLRLLLFICWNSWLIFTFLFCVCRFLSFLFYFLWEFNFYHLIFSIKLLNVCYDIFNFKNYFLSHDYFFWLHSALHSFNIISHLWLSVAVCCHSIPLLLPHFFSFIFFFYFCFCFVCFGVWLS